MSRKVDRARGARNNVGRHSTLMARGRGDPRDHRRESLRLGDGDLDPTYFRIVDGRLTLAVQPKALAGLLGSSVGPGLVLGSDGRLSVKLGETLALDRDGAVAVRFTKVDDAVFDAVPDPANSPASADALRDDLVANTLPAIVAALEALRDKVNELLATATTSVRT